MFLQTSYNKPTLSLFPFPLPLNSRLDNVDFGLFPLIIHYLGLRKSQKHLNNNLYIRKLKCTHLTSVF